MGRKPWIPCVISSSLTLEVCPKESREMMALADYLPFIRETIPERDSLTEKEVRRTLTGKLWGYYVAEHGVTGEMIGIVVWYRVRRSLYLWLGAVAREHRRRGVCDFILRLIDEGTSYKRWFTKTDTRNEAARCLLENWGFSPYGTGAEGNVLLMQRFITRAGRRQKMYESPTGGLTAKEVERATARSASAALNGKCIHISARPVHRTIEVRDSHRVMDLCEGCYGVMERAGCVSKVL